MNRKTEIALDMTTGSVPGLILRFSVPLMIGDLFQQVYSLTDSIIVGKFAGKESLAAIGSTTTLTNTLIGLFLGFGVGAGIVISQHFGAKETQKLSKAIHTAFLLSGGFALLFTVLGFFLAPVLLRLMATPDDVFPYALTYLRICFGGISGLVFYNICGGILRAIGDARSPTYALIVSTCANVALDLLLVVVFGLGIAGAAAATVAAQLASAAYLIHRLRGLDEDYALRRDRLRMDRDTSVRIFSIGFPIGLQRVITAFSNLLVQSHINAYESDSMAGWSIYSKIHQLAILPMENIATATITFVGQNFGAGQFKRLRDGVRTSLLLNLGVTSAVAGLICLLARPLSQLFTDETEVIRFGALFLRLVAPLFPISCVSRTYAAASRGIGRSKGPMYLMLLSYVVIRQIYLMVLSGIPHDVRHVALSYPLGWACASVLMAIYNHRQSRAALR